jgi:hypothetical protein
MGQNLSGERMDDHQVMMDMGQRDSTEPHLETLFNLFYLSYWNHLLQKRK